MPGKDHGRKHANNQQSYSKSPINDYEREALPSEIFNKQSCDSDQESQQHEMQSFFRPDFTIRMRNRDFPVCKRQLAKHSRYFARISHDGAYLEIRNNEPVDERLNEYSTNDENVVALMLLYVQKGGVVPDNLRNGTIAEIVDLAFMSRKWEINGLVRACEEQLIAHLNERNLHELLIVGRMMGFHKLVAAALETFMKEPPIGFRPDIDKKHIQNYADAYSIKEFLRHLKSRR